MQHIVIYFSFLLGPLLAVAQKPNPSPQYVRLVNAGFEFLEKKGLNKIFFVKPKHN
jgi:hypothetical protein